MPRRIPHQHGAARSKIRQLPLKQAMIRCKTWQKHEGIRFFHGTADPIVDGPAGGIVAFFGHRPSFLFWELLRRGRAFLC